MRNGGSAGFSAVGNRRPIVAQYFDWLIHLVIGDWGTSYRDGQSVLHVIGSQLFATLLLIGTATSISITLGSSIGIYSALSRAVKTAWSHQYGNGY